MANGSLSLDARIFGANSYELRPARANDLWPEMADLRHAMRVGLAMQSGPGGPQACVLAGLQFLSRPEKSHRLRWQQAA